MNSKFCKQECIKADRDTVFGSTFVYAANTLMLSFEKLGGHVNENGENGRRFKGCENANAKSRKYNNKH